jgi:hypothetical protein
MIQRGNAVYQTLILEALSATVENFAVDVFDVVNKGYLDTRLSAVNIIDVGGGVSLVAGDNTIRTLSGGPGVTLLSSAQVVALSTNVVSATNIGPSSAIQVYKDNIGGTLRFKSLSSGYGVHIADEISAVSIRVGYEKTEQTVLSSVGVFAVTVPENTYSILIEAAGGGGGGGGGGHGGGNSGYGGGGGGGGAYTTLTLSGSQVFGLTTLSATIGSGGSGGPGGTNSGSSPGTTGSTGGTTSVSSTSILLSAVGGAGGVGGQYSEGSGGSGGGAGGAPNGGNGGNGAYSTGTVFPASNGTSTFTPGGGGGGGVIGGGNYAAANGGTGSVVSGSIGGNGAGPSGTGANGVLGGGGGGGGGTPYTFPGAGGNGGNGFVRITFYIREGEYKNAGNGVQLLNEPLHEIRTLSAAGGTVLLSSSDIITISSTSETITATNVGSGSGVFKQKTGGSLEFYSLSGGNGVDIVTIGDTLVFDASGSVVNVGTGYQLGIDGTNQIRTISAVGSIALISSADVITLSGGGGGVIDNIGAGIEVGVEGTNQIRTISAGHGIEILSSTDVITFSTSTNVGYVVGDTWSYYDADKPPAVSSTQDDEFTGVSALDVKWTTFNATTAYNITFVYNRCHVAYGYPNPSSDAIQGITQNVQSLSGSIYTIWTRVDLACDAVANRGAGIMVTQTTTPASTQIVTFGIEYTNGSRAIVARRYNSYTSLSAQIIGSFPLSNDPKTSSAYLGITIATGSNYWKFVYSENGLDYIPVISSLSPVYWTPVLAGLYWHSSGDTSFSTTNALFKFFRIAAGQPRSPGGGMRTVGNGLIYTNTGGGVEILNPSTVNLKTLSAAGSVSLLSSTDVITISGSGGAVANIGAGTALGVQGTNQFRTLSAVGSLVLLSGTDVITLSAGGGGGGGGGFGEPVQVYDINGNIVEVGSTVPRDPDPRFLWLFT